MYKCRFILIFSFPLIKRSVVLWWGLETDSFWSLSQKFEHKMICGLILRSLEGPFLCLSRRSPWNINDSFWFFFTCFSTLKPSTLKLRWIISDNLSEPFDHLISFYINISNLFSKFRFDWYFSLRTGFSSNRLTNSPRAEANERQYYLHRQPWRIFAWGSVKESLGERKLITWISGWPPLKHPVN